MTEHKHAPELHWPEQYSLLLLPGLDGTGMLFEPFANQFPAPEKLKIISYPPDQKLCFDKLSKHVGQQIPDSGEFVLLAESFSGPIAARLVDHPRLAAIFFCASFLRSPRPRLLKILEHLPLSAIFRLPCPSFLLRHFGLGANCPDTTIALFRQTIKAVNPAVIEYRLRLLADFNDLEKLAGSKTRICYLQATDDRLVPTSCLEEIQQVNSNITAQKIDGPHFLIQRFPQRVIQAICLLMNKNF